MVSKTLPQTTLGRVSILLILLLFTLGGNLSAQDNFDCGTVLQIRTQECEALVAFYDSTNGDQWLDNAGWLQTSTPCDDWFGVECNNDNRVDSLVLQANQLTGVLPTELGNLSDLVWLQLNANAIGGAIPPQLGQLSHVTWLRLEDNQLTGTIPPELGNMTDLANLYLSGNPLGGTLPPALGNLENLQKLYLDNVGIVGELPTELGNLQQLGALTVSDNEALSGPLPDSFINLDNLTYFHYLGTALCQPVDPAFQSWIASIEGHYSEDISCAGGLIVREAEAVDAEVSAEPTPIIQSPEDPSNPLQPILVLGVLLLTIIGGIIYGYRQYDFFDA